MGRVSEPDTTRLPRFFDYPNPKKNENLLPEHEPEKFKIVYPNTKKSKN